MFKNLLPHVDGVLDYLITSLIGIAFLITLPYWIFVYPVLRHHFKVSALYDDEMQRAYRHGYQDGRSHKEVDLARDPYNYNIPSMGKKFWIANLCSLLIIIVAFLYYAIKIV